MKIYGKSPENPPDKDNIWKKSNELIVRPTAIPLPYALSLCLHWVQ
jgi:hypothetical protein